jgi:UPF0042 nucleotide-binding protein
MDYFCVGNLPIPLIKPFAEISVDGKSSEMNKIAITVDVRSGSMLEGVEQALCDIEKAGIKYEILYLDASDETLIKRYKESRRPHPMAEPGGRVEDGIANERQRTAFLKNRADFIIDTSQLLTRELKAEMNRIFLQGKSYKILYVSVVSFGFKYGIPSDADLVFDVRFLPNPYYDVNLRPFTGLDENIRNFVMSSAESGIFLDKLEDMLRFLIPNYVKEGKNQLVVAIGCTGGRHRSVTLAQGIYERLKKEPDYGIRIEHRDMARDLVKKQSDYEVN